MALFRPPIVRWAGAALDRSLFSKTIPIAAARILNIKNIARYRNEFVQTKEILQLERLLPIRPDIEIPTTKVILLNPEVKPEDQKTWSKSLREGVEKEEVGIIPYELKLDYDHWNYLDIVKSILPEDEQGEIPQGFSMVGHVAHMNLREEYLPYKSILAEVLMDKNPGVRTVINKIDEVGEHSEFRTFKYEVLRGPDDMNVEVSEGDCTFQFDYSKVYWNPRLETEHKRLRDLFQKGDVVIDVMAGVGPFAVPAGKKGVFVWANDLNPESNKSLKDAIKRNKVGHQLSLPLRSS
jgi:tRNA (guanine37-N1)-methyltransferase